MKGYEISLELMAMMIGIVSIIIAVRYALFFSRSRKAIARAMMFMLVAEALASGTTCAFNALAIADLIRVAPPIVMVLMRIIIFSAVLASTIHLANTIRSMTRDA
ncbi:MAG: hypothetical protein AAFP90_06670 [Planctomycetota bacterium]